MKDLCGQVMEWAQRLQFYVFRKIKGSNGVHASQNLSPYLLSLLFRHFTLSPKSFFEYDLLFQFAAPSMTLFWLVGPLSYNIRGISFAVQSSNFNLNSDHIFNTNAWFFLIYLRRWFLVQSGIGSYLLIYLIGSSIQVQSIWFLKLRFWSSCCL